MKEIELIISNEKDDIRLFFVYICINLNINYDKEREIEQPNLAN